MSKSPGISDTKDSSGRSRRNKQKCCINGDNVVGTAVNAEFKGSKPGQRKNPFKRNTRARPVWTEYSTAHARYMVPRIPRTAITGHVTTNISAVLTAKTPRIRQSMPDSKALNPVSGKIHLKEALRARPVWTAYSIAHVKYTAPQTSQPITPIGIVGCSSRLAS